MTQDIQAMLHDHEISTWLGGEKTSRQAQHHSDLQVLRADEACEFLLEETKFVEWYQTSGSSQLAILGDMGSRKSVAMSFLVDELSRRSEQQLPQPKICYHYCQNDETGKAAFVVSALILSLLVQLPGLKNPFCEWYKQAQLSGVVDPARNIWKLEEFLEKLTGEIDSPIFVVVDGLDECDTVSRNSLLKLLKALSRRPWGLKILLSSRPQEDILTQLKEMGMAKIDFSPSIQRDTIIVERTVERQLSGLSRGVKDIIIKELSNRAQGSAIWTKMIVELIQIRGITAESPMRSFIKQVPLPDELSNIYAALPLSIIELSWAATLGATQHGDTVGALAELVDHKRLMRLIHPFISRVDYSDITKHQVRLTHQSVKEFIRKEWTQDRPCLQRQASNNIHQKGLDQCDESLEACILDVCIRYLLLNEIAARDLFSEEQAGVAELPQGLDLFNDNEEPVEYDPYCAWETWEEDMTRYDPIERGFSEFFVYASCHWLRHFGAITAEPLPSLTSIEEVCRAGSTHLRNWIQQNCRPGCTITPRFQFESCLYDPLSITALYGSEAMLREMLKKSDFEREVFLREPAIKAVDQILDWGEISRIKILFLDEKLGPRLQNLDFFRLLLRKWHNHREKFDCVFELIDDVVDRLIHERWGNKLLCAAAGAGCIPIIRRLIRIAQRCPELRTSRLCNPEMLRLLLPRFQEGIHQVDHQGKTVIMGIVTSSSAAEDRHESARILLSQRGANRNSHLQSMQPNPLMVAARLGDMEMCRILVQIGKMDPLSILTGDSQEQLDLGDRAPENGKNMLQVLELLCAHAN
ncbi:hypothetical protein P170DRAFT_443267 [Aspergillus steynii IBT 23096]|uniref:Nephrocystin 3-like N-terminal domain-containing protein n=1 Tax=Aspergillus steynii IBT 23096 TaxID=1392250 RepID=A0A2I2GRJ3_9EURO|nr:uncharacterized protein P170DRAFT_443267 [Aspergillus steynii IBT 23096]PLB55500.1 hypothetical protein P170DRAFT_443267 [Aspergillus steynii IBT 23096]